MRSDRLRHRSIESRLDILRYFCEPPFTPAAPSLRSAAPAGTSHRLLAESEGNPRARGCCSACIYSCFRGLLSAWTNGNSAASLAQQRARARARWTRRTRICAQANVTWTETRDHDSDKQVAKYSAIGRTNTRHDATRLPRPACALNYSTRATFCSSLFLVAARMRRRRLPLIRPLDFPLMRQTTWKTRAELPAWPAEFSSGKKSAFLYALAYYCLF